MRKTRLAKLIGLLFPAIGAGNTPVVPDNGALPDQVGLINAILGINPLQEAVFNTATNTAAFTLTGQQIAGAAQNFLNLSGTLAGAAALTLPTVAALIAALPSNVQASPVGICFQLRVLNTGAGAFTWTITTNTGWTLNGSMGVANLTWRDYVITITSATTAVIQSVGTGTAP